jgi:hypothetical protein
MTHLRPQSPEKAQEMVQGKAPGKGAGFLGAGEGAGEGSGDGRRRGELSLCFKKYLYEQVIPWYASGLIEFLVSVQYLYPIC